MIESELLRHIYSRSAGLTRFPQVLVGPGDDCAVIRSPSGDPLLLTVDHLVEGRHFARLPNSPARPALDRIARKAISRSISDIAAMGGTPLASLATACLSPDFPQPIADDLFDRMNHWAASWNAPLIGGDISSSPDHASQAPLILTTTVIGIPHPARGPIRRSTARTGDAIFVTGALGNSLASGRHLTFEPRLREAAWICNQPTAPSAMIDISDGLGRDASRIAIASNVRLVIDAVLLPIHPDCPDYTHACSDGEDYELLFTAPAALDISAFTNSTGTQLTRIGIVEHGPPGCTIISPSGQPLDGCAMGWDHGRA